MLIQNYIAALLVDEELADLVWDAGLVPDELAAVTWVRMRLSVTWRQ